MREKGSFQAEKTWGADNPLPMPISSNGLIPGHFIDIFLNLFSLLPMALQISY